MSTEVKPVRFLQLHEYSLRQSQLLFGKVDKKPTREVVETCMHSRQDALRRCHYELSFNKKTNFHLESWCYAMLRVAKHVSR